MKAKVSRADVNAGYAMRDGDRFKLLVFKEYKCACGCWLRSRTIEHGTIGTPCYRKRQATDPTRFMLSVEGEMTGHCYSYSRISAETAKELVRSKKVQYVPLS